MVSGWNRDPVSYTHLDVYKRQVAMIDPRNLDTLLHPQFDAAALKAATDVYKRQVQNPFPI